jgi:hypothetical protein
MKKTSSNTELPSTRALIRESFILIKSDVLRLLIATNLVTVVYLLLTQISIQFQLTIASTPLYLIVKVLYPFLLPLSALFVLLVLAKPRAPLKEIVHMGLNRYFSYIWILTLMWCILLGSLVLFAIPAIIVHNWLILNACIFVVEGKTGLSALLTSREYIRGYEWPVFWRGMKLFIIHALFLWVFFSFRSTLLTPPNTSSDSLFHIWAIGGISILFNSISTPVIFGYTYTLYKHLKRRNGIIHLADTSQTKTFFKNTLVIGATFSLLLIGAYYTGKAHSV